MSEVDALVDMTPQLPYTTVFLSQRDLALKVPINFVTKPGVAITAACFSHLVYEDVSFESCFANLLAVGFRRFELDIYWDEERKAFSLCPVMLSRSGQVNPSSSTIVQSTQETFSTSPQSSTDLSSDSIHARRATSAEVSLSTSVSLRSSVSSLGKIPPTTGALPSRPSEQPIPLGQYSCTDTVRLSSFISQLLGYIQKTETASSQFPTRPAPTPSKFPGLTSLVGAAFSSNLSSYLYTYDDLLSDRLNLNESWYQAEAQYQTAHEYYSQRIDENGIASTEDGWPGESFIEFVRSRRLLLGWGTVDEQMSGYNFSGDAKILFPSNYIEELQKDVSATATGEVVHGCYLKNVSQQPNMINSSWAVETLLYNFSYPTSESGDLLPLLNLGRNLTACGIAPFLNIILLNKTAQENYQLYENYVRSTIWSWAPSEPRNYTKLSSSTTAALFRCAISSLTDSGHWKVADCSQKNFAACQAHDQPYNWTITSHAISYSFAQEACVEAGYKFAAPRTALENSFLTQAMRAREWEDHSQAKIWLAFNSLDVEGCWVPGGPNMTCPYIDYAVAADLLKRSFILIPFVAAIIVLALTTLTILAKAARNRRAGRKASKRGKRPEAHEGIPG